MCNQRCAQTRGTNTVKELSSVGTKKPTGLLSRSTFLVVSHVPLRAAGGTIAARIRASTGFRVFLDVFSRPPQVSQFPLYLKLNPGRHLPATRVRLSFPAFQLHVDLQLHNPSAPLRLLAPILPPNPSLQFFAIAGPGPSPRQSNRIPQIRGGGN